MAVEGVKTVEWYDLLSLVCFVYFRPQFDLTPDHLKVRESQIEFLSSDAPLYSPGGPLWGSG